LKNTLPVEEKALWKDRHSLTLEEVTVTVTTQRTIMGKKSKRNRGSNNKQEVDHSRPAPSLRRREEEEEETKDNLRFQDPFIEEFRNDDEDEEWEDMQEDDDEEGNDAGGGKMGGRGGGQGATSSGADSSYEVIHSWNPLTGQALQPGQALEMDASAYKMHHAISGEWPALTFDFLRDDLGDHRTRFPHSLILATGTQAQRSQDNSLCIMKLSDLARMPQENEDDDDILGEEYDNEDNDDDNKDSDDDDSSASSSEDDDDIDLDPIVEHYNVKHVGGVNRLRCMPQRSNIIATWSDTGKVNLFNVDAILERFAVSQGKFSSSSPGEAMSAMPTKPFFSYSKHSTEGYAMDWSRVQEGALVTGDCHGNIHLWTPRGGDSYTVTASYQKGSTVSSGQSIEDLQWSPKEATVFASAECNGFVRIFDTRAPGRAMLSHQIHSSSAFGSNDVNVLSWNALVSNLLATGSDSGILSVWDLRKFSSSSDKDGVVSPLARFSPHKTPITSVEWHPTDESMLAVTDDLGAYIYDLSVEEDTKTTSDDNDGDYQVLATSKDIPPQLLFVHSGSEQFKEVHWHAQIPSCLMTTALSGYSVFIPSNL
jgi:ribosome assembly protein RRB1